MKKFYKELKNPILMEQETESEIRLPILEQVIKSQEILYK